MKPLLRQIVQYVLYFKSLFWSFLALMNFMFPVEGTMLPVYSFLFLLNGIVFFCIGFAFERSPKDVFRAGVAFLAVNVLLVLMDGFSMMDALSIVLDGLVLGIFFWERAADMLKKD